MRWNFLDFKRNELAMQRDSKMKQSLLHPILLAGLAGGLAELVWVMLYSSLTQVSGSEVARQIAVTLFSALAHAPFAAALGVAIHFALSLALAVAFVWIVWRTFIRKRGIAWTFAALESGFRGADAVLRHAVFQAAVWCCDGVGVKRFLANGCSRPPHCDPA
jgi:hypothetical protein